MVELEQQTSEMIQMYCKRAGAVCRNAVNYPSNNPINQCAVLTPTEVIAAFESNGCNKASISYLDGRKIRSKYGTMKVSGFESFKSG